MSVVVWDGKTLAADMQIDCDGVRRKISKLRRLPDGTLLGMVGAIENGIALFRWFEQGRRPDEWPECQSSEEWAQLIVVSPDGSYGYYEQYPEFQQMLTLFDAWGAGGKFAVGALAMGADSRRAVEIANQFCIHCGMGVEALDLEMK